ncbi:MAG: ribosomal protein L7/L12 [Bacteroidales bacterium]
MKFKSNLKNFWQMQRILLFLIFITATSFLYAQIPQAFSYKLQIRGNSGNIRADKKINLKISIIQDNVEGNAVYIEKHQVNTSPAGLVDIEIGRGTPIQGLFTEIDWKNWPYFIKAELDLKCTEIYTLLAVTELLTVPFAMLAANVSDNNDADADPENELQELSYYNDTIFLSRGGFVVLPDCLKGNYYFGDIDGDGFGDRFRALWVPENAEPLQGYVLSMYDCNDNNPDINPGATEISGDGIDQDCDGKDTETSTDPDFDYDGDGFSINTGDCNDNNNAVFPGNSEICDNMDNNCNSEVDENLTCTTPSSFDLRNLNGKNWMTPIKNQGSCGSCYAFATVAAFETKIKMQTNQPDLNIDLSEQEILSCGTGHNGCNGGNPGISLEYIKLHGIVSESCFPYGSGSGTVPPCNLCNTGSEKYKLESFSTLNYTGPDDIKNALFTNGPIVVIIDVYSDLYDYQTGIYIRNSNNFTGSMTNLIIGYNDEEQYWILRNNWGTSWGENGYYRVAYSQTGSIVKTDFIWKLGDIDYDADGYSVAEGDCNDADASVNPGASEICGDGVDQDCNGSDLECNSANDNDLDGFTVSQGDCNDFNIGIHPGAIEIPYDGTDQNCDGIDDYQYYDVVLLNYEVELKLEIIMVIRTITGLGLFAAQNLVESSPSTVIEGVTSDEAVNIKKQLEDAGGVVELVENVQNDYDGDGFTENQGDCNDASAAIHPGASEICGDGIDQDCSGSDLNCPKKSNYLNLKQKQ